MGSISHALQQEPAVAHDIVHGPGLRYALAEGALSIELFPPHAERHTGIVRLTTMDSLQEFYRQPPPALRADGLIFQTSELLISLAATGELATYRRIPGEGPTMPPDPSESNDEGSGPSDVTARASDDPRASDVPFQGGLTASEGQPRVIYSGRLGTDPRTKQSPKGRFVMEFPVAVPIEGQEKPEWKSTVVFDEKARSLEGQLSKGSRVDIVAYEHRTVRRDAKTGKRQERVEYYATAVTPRPRRSPSDAPSSPGASER